MSTTPEVRIDRVGDDAAGELLTVRRAAFVSEAQLYDDPHIPPLTQTLEELRADLADPAVVTVGAWAGPRLVGSLRVGIDGSKATLGRLAVVPDLQGQGIGTQMLLAVPGYLPQGITEVWVFTGKDSLANLAMYGKHGFEHEFDQTTGDLTYAYLRKILGANGEASAFGDAAADDQRAQRPGPAPSAPANRSAPASRGL